MLELRDDFVIVELRDQLGPHPDLGHIGLLLPESFVDVKLELARATALSKSGLASRNLRSGSVRVSSPTSSSSSLVVIV